MKFFGWFGLKREGSQEVLDVWQIADIFEEAGKSEQWRPDLYKRLSVDWDTSPIPQHLNGVLATGEEAMVQLSSGAERDYPKGPTYREQLLEAAMKLRTIPRKPIP